MRFAWLGAQSALVTGALATGALAMGSLAMGALAMGCPRGSDVAEAPDGVGGFITGAGAGSAVANTSVASGAGGPVSSSSSAGGSGHGGAGGQNCADFGVGEPNESENTAHELTMAPIGDCDGEGGDISGTIAPGDVDWFTYEGDDSLTCQVDPTRTFASGGDLRLCKFAECVGALANTVVNCPSGTSAEVSPQGRPGCCANEGFTLSGDLLGNDVNCTGTSDEHIFIYVRIDASAADTCDDYTLAYHY